MSLMLKLSEIVSTPVETIKLVVFGKLPDPSKTLSDLTLKDGDFMMMTVKPVDKKKLEKPKEEVIVPHHEEEKKDIKIPETLPPLEKPKVELKIEEKEEKKELPKKEEQKKEEPKKEVPMIDPKIEEKKNEELKKEEAKKEEQKKEEKKEMPKKEEKKDTGNNTNPQLSILVSMGFSSDQSMKALQLSGNNVELAIDLITSGEINSMINNGHQDPSHNIEMQNMLAGIQGQPNNFQDEGVIIPDVLSDYDKEAIESIKAMGFKEEDVKKAYFGTGKNKDNAINYLLENSQ